MLQFMNLIPAMGRPAGSFLASRLFLLSGKKALKARWRRIEKELSANLDVLPADRARLASIPEVRALEVLSSGSQDELRELLAGAGVSEEVARLVMGSVQFFIMELAKNNAVFFDRYMVEAQGRQLDGLAEIKRSLGAGDDMRSCIADVEVNQSRTLSLLQEIGDTLAALVHDTGTRPPADCAVPRTADETNTASFRDSLLAARPTVYADDAGNAVTLLFRSAVLFFGLYRSRSDPRFYELGMRCYDMGTLLRVKSPSQGGY